MTGYGQNPGGRMTRNNRFAQMLQQQDVNAGDINGSHMKGLASILRQGMAGFYMGEDRRDEEEFTAAMAEAMAGPELVAGPGTPPSAKYEGNIPDTRQRLAEKLMDNPNNQRMSRMAPIMAQAQIADERANRIRDEGRAYNQSLIPAAQAREDALLEQKYKQEKDVAAMKNTDPSLYRSYVLAAKQLTDRGLPAPYFTDWLIQTGLGKQGGIYTPPGMPEMGPQVPGDALPPGNAPPAMPPVTNNAAGGNALPPPPPPNANGGMAPPPPPNANLAMPAHYSPIDGPPADIYSDPPDAVTPPFMPGQGGQGAEDTLGVKIIPGSPLDLKQRTLGVQEQKEGRAGRTEQLNIERKGYKEKLRIQNMYRAGGTVVQDAGRMLELIEGAPFAGTGFPAAALKGVPIEANDAYQIEKMKESILSNTSVNEIMQMKAASETGGALGQIPMAQMHRMEQLLGSIDNSQRREIVVDNLKRVQNLWMDIVHGTPQQIQSRVNQRRDELRDPETNKLIRKGNFEILTQERADQLAQRNELSFDEMGRTKKVPNPEGVTDAEVKRAMRKYRIDRPEVIRRYNELNQ
jgi:hypothetical protein